MGVGPPIGKNERRFVFFAVIGLVRGGGASIPDAVDGRTLGLDASGGLIVWNGLEMEAWLIGSVGRLLRTLRGGDV